MDYEFFFYMLRPLTTNLLHMASIINTHTARSSNLRRKIFPQKIIKTCIGRINKKLNQLQTALIILLLCQGSFTAFSDDTVSYLRSLFLRSHHSDKVYHIKFSKSEGSYFSKVVRCWIIFKVVHDKLVNKRASLFISSVRPETSTTITSL